MGANLVLKDQNGHTFEGYGIMKDTNTGSSLTVVTVWPDGIIGSTMYGVEGVHKYFKIIFRSIMKDYAYGFLDSVVLIPCLPIAIWSYYLTLCDPTLMRLTLYYPV